MSDLPAGARPLGSAPGESVFATPGEPPTVYVRRGDAVERWLAVVPPHGPTPTALFIGDSITVGSRGAIVRALPGWTTRFDARVGRNTTEGIQVATRIGVRGKDAVVVELGTNDGTATGYRGLVRRMLSLVRPAPLVIWVTVHRDLEFVPEINADIRAGVGELPNTALADWVGVVRPEDLLADGIHPSDQGKRVMAALLSTPLERWYLAATGRGDAACAPFG